MTSREPEWPVVWQRTAERLTRHWEAGRGHLLTEDTLRLCLIEALGDYDVAPSRLRVETLAGGLGRGKLDLTIDGPTGTVVELKYPRDSRTGFSPDTMTMGELLRDYCRVAVVEANDRWVAQVINQRLATYLAKAAGRLGFEWSDEPGATMVLDRAALSALPRTALTALGETSWRLPVRATCHARFAIAHGLTLFAHRIDPPDDTTVAGPLMPAQKAPSTGTPAPARAASGSEPKGARAAILAAVDHLLAAHRRGTVTVAEVLEHLRAKGTTYADSTIRTMMTSHMCVDAQGPGIGTYDDLERLGRGEYRRRSS